MRTVRSVDRYGIANFLPTFVERIFDRFSPGRRTNAARQSGGVGLGLAICQKIVHAHGGQVSASIRPSRVRRSVFRSQAARRITGLGNSFPAESLSDARPHRHVSPRTAQRAVP